MTGMIALRRVAPVLVCVALIAGCESGPPNGPTPQASATSVAQANTPTANSTSTPLAVATNAPATSAPAATSVPAATATAAPASPTPAPPPASGCEETPIDFHTQGGAAYTNAEAIESQGGYINAEMVVTYSVPSETMIAGCQLHLRTYNGKLVGPTLRARPGDTLYIEVANQLPEAHDSGSDHSNDFNSTNFHTHGMHVSPTGNSDNVLLELDPGHTIRLEIKIPPDHPPGTFWYHSHLHGATAVQVSSGMSGALIIEGDIDRVPAIAAAKEQIMVLQQISYDTQGQIESMDDFGPGQWDILNRQHTINGQLFPKISMQPGELQRWRLIHSGIRETTCVALLGPAPQGWDPATATISQVLELPPNTLNEIAVDGLTLGRINPWQTIELEPGYRSDVLVKAGQPGLYYLADISSPVSQGVNCNLRGDDETDKMLGTLEVGGSPLPDMPLPTEAELAALQLPVTINDVEISGLQTVEFCVCPQEGGGVTFTVNGEEFDPNSARELRLGAAEEWELSVDPNSLAPAHPFHIHVNPFQLTRTGPDGQPEVVWKDTLLVRIDEPLKIRTRYQDYIGKFVLHCHILDHEDGGMMEVVEVMP